MDKLFLRIIFFTILISASSFGQAKLVIRKNIPLSFSQNLPPLKAKYKFSRISENPTQTEENIKRKPYQFGQAIPFLINFLDAAQSDTVSNGIIYRVQLFLKGAKSVNINYGKFVLGKGASFYVYTTDKRKVLGPFFEKDNSSLKYATSILKGEYVVLELFQPFLATSSEIIIESVVYGYRSIFENEKEGFGSSGNCNKNAFCDINNYRKSIKSTVMVLTSSNTRICTGTLLNNVKQDKTPYIITADHCAVTANSIIMFDYMSSDCANDIDGDISKIMVGVDIIAKSGKTDFKLLKLKNKPPSSYDAYYSGWSTEKELNKTPVHTVHHPSGDIKKISKGILDYVDGRTVFSDYFHEVSWQTGVTEDGSSGSGLFTSKGEYFIGQLFGGLSSCFKQDLQDNYGNISSSFDLAPAINSQLRHWLAPNTSSKEIKINGLHSSQTLSNNDVGILGLNSPSNRICEKTYTPKVEVYNFGKTSVDTITLICWLDDKIESRFTWKGMLSPNQSEVITLNAITLSEKTSHTLKIVIASTNPKGTNRLNDTLTATIFSIPEASDIDVKILYDDYPLETDFYIAHKASNKAVYYSNSPLFGANKDSMRICLSANCYKLVLTDDGNDGFCCGSGKGELTIKEVAGNNLVSEKSFNGKRKEIPFCVGDSCALTFFPQITDLTANGLGKVRLNIIGGDGSYTYSWSNGATTDFVEHLAAGVYTVKVTDNKYKNCSLEATIDIKDNSKGVLNPKTDLEQLVIYPNPANKFSFNIHTLKKKQLKSVKLFDYLGRSISCKLSKTSTTKYRLESQSHSGAYFLLTTFEDGTVGYNKLIVLE